VFPQLRRQLISIRSPLLLEQEQQNWLDEPVQVAHRTRAWMIGAVARTYSMRHLEIDPPLP
jgi:hypothetical protein